MSEEQGHEPQVDRRVERPGDQVLMLIPAQVSLVTGWARIHRLVIVYMTISSSIGYRLSKARCAVRNLSPALRWDRYTATTWPRTMSTTCAYQTVEAWARAKLGW